MDEIRKTRKDRWGRVCSVETEEEHKKMIVAQEAYDREHNSDRYYFPETRRPLHKSLKFNIERRENNGRRPCYFWETEEGLEIAIVRGRESIQFSLEYITGCLEDISDEIFKSVKKTDTLKDVSAGARTLARAIRRWMEGTLKSVTAFEENFQMLEKENPEYFGDKLSSFWLKEDPMKKSKNGG